MEECGPASPGSGSRSGPLATREARAYDTAMNHDVVPDSVLTHAIPTHTNPGRGGRRA